MNLNPFVYSYKRYPNCKLATIVSNLCGAMQRLFIVFAVGFTLVVIFNFNNVTNWGETLCGAGIMFLLWLLIKNNKDKWSDTIAAKQEAIDNPDNIEEK